MPSGKRPPRAASSGSEGRPAPAKPPRPPAPPPPEKPAPEKAAAPPPPPRPEVPPPPPQAPAGSDYALVIERAHHHTLRKLGASVEVNFKVTAGPHAGSVALGQFPLAGKGLPVLISAALGESFTAWDEALATRLVGARVLADVIRTGAAEKPQAIVRNLRAAGSVAN